MGRSKSDRYITDSELLRNIKSLTRVFDKKPQKAASAVKDSLQLIKSIASDMIFYQSIDAAKTETPLAFANIYNQTPLPLENFLIHLEMVARRVDYLQKAREERIELCDEDPANPQDMPFDFDYFGETIIFSISYDRNAKKVGFSIENIEEPENGTNSPNGQALPKTEVIYHAMKERVLARGRWSMVIHDPWYPDEWMRDERKAITAYASAMNQPELIEYIERNSRITEGREHIIPCTTEMAARIAMMTGDGDMIQGYIHTLSKLEENVQAWHDFQVNLKRKFYESPRAETLGQLSVEALDMKNIDKL